MSDDEIEKRFGWLMREAQRAFSEDASYSADIAKKANLIIARRAKKIT